MSEVQDAQHSSSELDSAVASLESARNDGKIHLLLAASGSVATIKIPNIINALSPHVRSGRLSIRLILTESARHFLQGQSLEQPYPSTLPYLDAIYTDASEWPPAPNAWKRGTGVLHIELRRWADILVIAPLSANTLAKICNGLSDNLLTSVVRAWDVGGRIDGVEKSILVAPAMNVKFFFFSLFFLFVLSFCCLVSQLLVTAMWLHPITARHIKVLADEWGVKDDASAMNGETEESKSTIGTHHRGWFEVLMPQHKTLACGDIGDGAMKEWSEIVEVIKTRLRLQE